MRPHAQRDDAGQLDLDPQQGKRRRRLRPARDFVFDHTAFLQEMAGDSDPREIDKGLALIEDAPAV